MSTITEDTLSPHEANYNLIAAAVATASATILTLLTTLGTVDIVSKSFMLKSLLEAELLVIEFSLIISVISLLRRGTSEKRRLVVGATFLLIFGTLLLWSSATILIFG